MPSKRTPWWLAGALSLPFLAGCTTLFGRPAQKPAQAQDTEHAAAEADGPEQPLEEESGDSEAGAAHLTRLLKQFRNALEAKKFTDAETLLARAERGIKKASTMTRSHPDFEDIADSVKNSRPRLEDAIERDRIERRNASIDALMRQGELAMGQAQTILTELAAHPPTSQDLDHLNEAVQVLATLKENGETYLAEARYRTHATSRDKLQAEVVAAQARTSRQLSLQAAVVPHIEAGISAANRAKSADQAADQLAAWHEVVDQFAQCAQSLQEMQNQPGFDRSMVLQTRLGFLSAQDTQAACVATVKQATERLHRFAWESSVNAQIAKLTSATQAMKQAGNAAEAEVAATQAVAQMRICEDNTTIVRGQPGIEPKLGFGTPFGKLTAAALVQRCASEATRLSALLPSLHWQTSAMTFIPRLIDIQGRVTAAQGTEEPAQAAEAWSVALGGLQECLARSQELLSTPGVATAVIFDTPWGKLTMPAISQSCKEAHSRSEKSMGVALSRAQGKAFLASCHGDEADVVRREGMPTRIEVMPQGRMFIYPPTSGSQPRRYGFNKDGQRVDFSLQWKAAVQSLIEQLAQILPAARGEGKAAQEAIATVMPLLESCQNGSVTERHPGFEESAVFSTPFGQVRATELRKACSGESSKLRARQGTLAWQSRAEALRDRANEAENSLVQAAATTDPNQQVQLIAAARGGLTECTERADALVHAQLAEKKYKVTSLLGTLTVGELGRACDKARTASTKRLEAAMAALKLQIFSASCRNDEVEAAHRFGLPSRIEPLGAGRLFIYGNKRIAFDANGRRTEEKLLK